jgi:DNA adenine methylase
LKNRSQDRKTCAPFLRWAGSKKQLVSTLVQGSAKEYGTYIEPFAGSACLFFKLMPSKSILGDINHELIKTYLEVKHRPLELSASLRALRKGRQTFLKLRKLDLSRLSGSERAARFIFLNRYCFNGLYRTNKAGQFNVPYGGDKSGGLPSSDFLKQCSVALRRTRLVAADFEKVLGMAKKGDFVYMDPPFSVKSRRVFNEYDPTGFNSGHLNRLRSWMERFERNGISFLVSYADCTESRILMRDFFSRTVVVKRNIAGFASDRGESREVLISSNPI